MTPMPLRLDFFRLQSRPGWMILAVLLAVLLKGSVYLAARSGAFGGVENGFAYVSLSAFYSLFLTSFLLCILSASSLSGDYARGTLRMELARPVSRNAYYFSRAFYWITVAFLVLALDAILGFSVGLAGFGFTDVADPNLQGPQFAAGAMAWSSLKAYALAFLGLASLIAVGQLISVILPAPTTAIGAAAAVFFLFEGIRHIFREPLASYVVTTYSHVHLQHLSRLARGIAEYQPPGSLAKALCVPLAYLLLAHALGVHLFRRKDVLE